MQNNSYFYLKDLDAHRPKSDVSHLIKSKEVCTSLSLSAWAEELLSHLDRRFAEFILQGIQNGFRIGFDRRSWLQPASSNLSVDNPQIVSEYLLREVSLGRMWSIPVSAWPKGLHISPLGLIPKKNKPGKWCLIVDLSSPEKKSVNEGIDPKLASLAYSLADHLAALVALQGRLFVRG